MICLHYLFVITDGVCNIEGDEKIDFIRTKTRSGAKCYSVLIGSEVTETIKQFSEKVFSLTQTPFHVTAAKFFLTSASASFGAPLVRNSLSQPGTGRFWIGPRPSTESFPVD